MRTTYILESISCCLDDVTGLGNFLEVEILKEKSSEYDAAMQEIKQILRQLSLDMTDSIITSYLGMLQKKTN